MIRNILLVLIVAIGLPACKTTPTTEPDQTNAPAQSDQANAAPAAQPGPFDPRDMALWQSQEFRQRLAESYLSETEIEPAVTSEEFDRLKEIFDFIGSENPDWAKAEAMVKKALTPGSSAVFDFTLGNIYFQSERPLEAIDAYKAAVKKHPKYRRAYRNLGLLYIRQEQYPDAATAMTKVIELGGGDALTYGLLGFAYLSMTEPISAESAYRQAILVDPKSIDWKMGLARSFFMQQRYAEAAALCQSLLKDRPQDENFWMLQANAYIGMGKTLDAAENFEMVDRMGKSNYTSLATLGDIYINEQLFDLAARAYGRAIALDQEKKDPKRAILAATALVQRGASDEATKLIAIIEENYADKLDDKQKLDLLRLNARTAAITKATEKEAEILKQILELDPRDGEALILLGRYHAAQAIEAIDKAKQAKAANDEAAVAEHEKLVNAQAAQAVFYYERAQSLEKFEVDAKVQHAQLLVAQGLYRDALPLLKQAQDANFRENIQKYLDQIERLAKSQAQ